MEITFFFSKLLSFKDLQEPGGLDILKKLSNGPLHAEKEKE